MKPMARNLRAKKFPKPDTADKNARKEYLRQRNQRRKCRLSKPSIKFCRECTQNEICAVEATQFWLNQ